jgi:hypothetical protein
MGRFYVTSHGQTGYSFGCLGSIVMGIGALILVGIAFYAIVIAAAIAVVSLLVWFVVATVRSTLHHSHRLYAASHRKVGP